jgi:hypothetical protein
MLCACAAGAGVGASADKSIPVDPITGKPDLSAVVISNNSRHAGDLIPGKAIMEITCFKGQPIVQFDFGVKIGTNADTSLGYRFDEKPGHEIAPHILRGNRTALIDKTKDVAQFISEARTSRVLVLRLDSRGRGRTTTEFQLGNGGKVIDTIVAMCPLR